MLSLNHDRRTNEMIQNRIGECGKIIFGIGGG
jgi:hypothetical protein